jgi:3'(2'), 5'-bisphosphate nucleotidase
VNYSQEQKIAIEAVTQAAALCQQVRAEMVEGDSLEKGDRSPVTVADFGAQALVCRLLAENFPADAIVAEEDSSDLQQHPEMLSQVTQYVQRFQPGATAETVCRWIDAGNGSVSERYWTLDPIDGTKGFLRNDQYAIALALVEQGQVKVAALACPALALSLDDPNSETGSLFMAVRGEGATMAPLGGGDFRSIQVSQDPAGSRFVESVEAGHGHHDRQQAVARAAGISRPSLRMDSQAKYGAVARGHAALYLRLPSPKSPDYREKIWDHAAGALIVEEAGGRVTDMYGQPLDFGSGQKMVRNRGVVVSNDALHPAVIEALSRFTANLQD